MSSHGHSHGGGCEHEYEPVGEGAQGVLYTMNHHIDLDKVVTLNETVDGSGAKVFKEWDNRMDREEFVESDADEELLFSVPFRGRVKIMGIVLAGDLDGSHPASMKLYKDRPSMSFDDTSLCPDQEFSIKQDSQGQIDYALRGTKFSDITHLSLFIPTNFGAERTKIYYIGLRGEYLSEKPSADTSVMVCDATAMRDFFNKVPIVTYESRPMLKDHKADLPSNAMSRNIF